MKISKIYTAHKAELESFLGYIRKADGTPSANAIRLGISAAEVTRLFALLTAFLLAYARYTNPDTHGQAAVHAMKVADKNAFAVILPLRQKLKYSGLLKPRDYLALGIHENKTSRTHAAVPNTVPDFMLIAWHPLLLIFALHNGTHRTALPRRHKIAIEIAIVEAGVIPTESDYRFHNPSSRSRFKFIFDAHQIGMHIYVRIAFENNAGRGQLSPPKQAIIVG